MSLVKVLLAGSSAVRVYVDTKHETDLGFFDVVVLTPKHAVAVLGDEVSVVPQHALERLSAQKKSRKVRSGSDAIRNGGPRKGL